MQKTFILLIAIFTFANATINAARIGDITTIAGVRSNTLEGYGLVFGLAGTGDRKLDLANQAVVNAVRRYGLLSDLKAVDKAKNLAFVHVKATIGPYAKNGDKLNVIVSSLGNASSLQGGTLALTPLRAANGQIYAAAEGSVSVGGYIGGEGGATVQKNHPTTGVIAGGAMVERAINTPILNNMVLDFTLLKPNFTTAVRIADAINRVYPASSQAINPATVNIEVPLVFTGQTPNFIAAIQRLDAAPDVPARVVINERNGTIVITEAVTLSPVAISYGSLVIQVTTINEVVQPAAFAAGTTQVEQNVQVTVEENEVTGGFEVVHQQNPTIRDLADALNSLGVTTRDMINIFQTLETSGALHAEILVQ